MRTNEGSNEKLAKRNRTDGETKKLFGKRQVIIEKGLKCEGGGGASEPDKANMTEDEKKRSKRIHEKEETMRDT